LRLASRQMTEPIGGFMNMSHKLPPPENLTDETLFAFQGQRHAPHIRDHAGRQESVDIHKG
jgi:hypothetical protein